MTVQSIARESVVTVGVDESVDAVVDIMEEQNVGSVVVVDDGRPVGMLTDRDIVVDVLGADADPATTTVGDVMSGDLITVDADIGVLDLFRELSEAGVRRVPVIDDGDLVGIVTLDDLLVLLSMELQSVANIIRTESPPYEVSATDLFD